MAKLRHLAILTHQPDRLADFYTKVFEMEEMYRTKNGSVHLSRRRSESGDSQRQRSKRTGASAGIVSFWISRRRQQRNRKRIQEIYPEGAPKEREATYAEGRGSDPDGNLFDISTVGWGGTRRMDL